jgi:hypothetical protein
MKIENQYCPQERIISAKWKSERAGCCVNETAGRLQDGGKQLAPELEHPMSRQAAARRAEWWDGFVCREPQRSGLCKTRKSAGPSIPIPTGKRRSFWQRRLHSNSSPGGEPTRLSPQNRCNNSRRTRMQALPAPSNTGRRRRFGWCGECSCPYYSPEKAASQYLLTPVHICNRGSGNIFIFCC